MKIGEKNCAIHKWQKAWITRMYNCRCKILCRIVPDILLNDLPKKILWSGFTSRTRTSSEPTARSTSFDCCWAAPPTLDIADARSQTPSLWILTDGWRLEGGKDPWTKKLRSFKRKAREGHLVIVFLPATCLGRLFPYFFHEALCHKFTNFPHERIVKNFSQKIT